MKKFILFIIIILLFSAITYAHHGVASIGSVGLEGGGAPIETSNSATLPQNSFLYYLKLDYASFKKFTDEVDDEKDFNAFWMFGLGYGIKPYLSSYIFFPFSVKKTEDNSFNTAGFADLSYMFVLGFKYDEGFRLIPKNESVDDMKDWHFTVNLGGTIPISEPNIKDSNGEIDPGMSLGFGYPSITGGITTTKVFYNNFTFSFDTSYIKFFEYKYENDVTYLFGSEFRVNSALMYALLKNSIYKFRLDTQIEANYLNLQRDEENGKPLSATGGNIIYLLPGIRVYYNTISAGCGVKLPAWTSLNEGNDQQGAEGKENYRLIVTFSTLF